MKKVIIPCLIFLFQWNANAQFFDKIKNERVTSNQSIEWKNFGPGMSGYNEEFWCHPTDNNVMFMGPDMHVSYGTWDGAKTWQTIKDSDGDGLDLERVLDIVFSKKNPDFGLALERRGKVFKSLDRGRSWKLLYTIPGNEKNPF
ncbi:WD40/YVTN/BNR-like repeat-containing protein, partial [Flavobacterium sp.]|uniref:WD40/YVTN/BNR-like repeat-containing protein n=1 Tax=Flavobacterium sp. TaxID=239 RepID=UPI003C6724C9